MTSSGLDVGKEVVSYCGRCKLALAHVIVTMKTPTAVGKCQCKTCNANHNYRDPDKVNAKKTKSTRAKKAPAVPIAELWKQALSRKSDKDIKNYSISGEFIVGDIIEHPSFGKGIVEQVIDNNKIQAIFEQNYKILIFGITT